jgi:2-dehydro-3-deoxyphosphogluconate aldolase/(4S)-4-hydroxy-2-oxoglutarate aldolase
MSHNSILDQVAAFGVVPVVGLEKVEPALPLAEALSQGGLPVIEITFRTAAAADAIRAVSCAQPQMIVGAGTILTLAQLESAKASGAAFGVSPGVNPRVIRHAQQLGLPFVPGVATPSDIEQALELGCRLLKFFPAEALGGVAMLEALAGPFKHTGVRFMPTGGVSAGNLANYLKLDVVAAAGGTWIARNEDVAAARWDMIRQRCRETVALVAKVRGA